jgi:S-DNA-T family DNA segregation ATPase FtsK/SpoIIIE
MANVYTSKYDEETIGSIIRHGLIGEQPKWMVLRIALAKSMTMTELPDSHYDNIDVRGSEYRLQQVTGKDYSRDNYGERDLNNAICALLSVLHKKDLFEDDKTYHDLLQRHIRRGLDEVRKSWSSKDDFYDYLYQDFFAASTDSYMSVENKQDTLDHDLLAQLKSAIGLSAELVETKKGYRLQRYVLRFTQAGDLQILRKGLDKLCFQAGIEEGSLSVSASNEPLTAYLDMPLPKGQWQAVTGNDFKAWLQLADKNTPLLNVWLGVDVLGVPQTFNLEAAPHVLVAGTTGSGKSVCIHAMLLSLMSRLSPQQVQICLIDPKRMDYAVYDGFPHLYQNKIITEMSHALETLASLVDAMEERSRKFSNCGYTSLEDVLADKENFLTQVRRQDPQYDASHLLSYLVVCIDELADLMMQYPEIESLLVRLAQMGRAMGIRLILATQRPDAKTFSGKLRSNIPARIALAVQKSTESKIILDEVGAEHLLKPGDMLLRHTAGAEIKRIHGVEIKADDIIRCLNEAKQHYA